MCKLLQKYNGGTRCRTNELPHPCSKESTFSQEAGAVVWALEHFAEYTQGYHVIVQCDHINISFFVKKSAMSPFRTCAPLSKLVVTTTQGFQYNSDSASSALPPPPPPPPCAAVAPFTARSVHDIPGEIFKAKCFRAARIATSIHAARCDRAALCVLLASMRLFIARSTLIDGSSECEKRQSLWHI